MKYRNAGNTGTQAQRKKSVRQLFQALGGFLELGQKGAGLFGLGALGFDDLGGGAGGEFLVLKLGFRALQLVLCLGALLGDALELLGDIAPGPAWA